MRLCSRPLHFFATDSHFFQPGGRILPKCVKKPTTTVIEHCEQVLKNNKQMEGDKSRMDAGPCSTVDCQGCTTPPEHLIFGSNRYPQQRPAVCKPGGDRLIDSLCEKQKWTFFPLEDIVEMEPDNADAFVDAMLQVLDVNTLLNFRLVNSVWKTRLDKRKAFWAMVQGRRMPSASRPNKNKSEKAE